MSESNPKTIVCLGDSITCNWASKSYVDFWQELMDKKKRDVKLIASGINGETAQDGYYRVDRDVITHKPDLVTIMFGHNDADPNRNMSAVLFANYLRKIINYLQHETRASFWLLTPNQLGDAKFEPKYEQYIRMIKQAALDKNIHCVDLFNVFHDHKLDEIFTGKITSTYIRSAGKDWIHPNELGHRIMAEKLMSEFEKVYG